MNDLLEEIITTLEHARLFITSREKMHKTGVELYDALIDKLLKKQSEVKG